MFKSPGWLLGKLGPCLSSLSTLDDGDGLLACRARPVTPGPASPLQRHAATLLTWRAE